MRKEAAKHPKLVAATLKHWKRADDLIDADPAANDELSAGERKAWRAFWADVEALLASVK